MDSKYLAEIGVNFKGLFMTSIPPPHTAENGASCLSQNTETFTTY